MAALWRLGLSAFFGRMFSGFFFSSSAYIRFNRHVKVAGCALYSSVFLVFSGCVFGFRFALRVCGFV